MSYHLLFICGRPEPPRELNLTCWECSKVQGLSLDFFLPPSLDSISYCFLCQSCIVSDNPKLDDKLTPFFSAKRAPSTPNCDSGSPPDVSPNLDEFEEDNGEASESTSSGFESASTESTVIADRWIPQPRSRSGYLAYVLFTGPNAGVFYNWSV